MEAEIRLLRLRRDRKGQMKSLRPDEAVGAEAGPWRSNGAVEAEKGPWRS